MTLGIFFFEGNVDGQFFVPKTFWWVGRELAGNSSVATKTQTAVDTVALHFQSSGIPRYRHKKLKQ